MSYTTRRRNTRLRLRRFEQQRGGVCPADLSQLNSPRILKRSAMVWQSLEFEEVIAMFTKTKTQGSARGNAKRVQQRAGAAIGPRWDIIFLSEVCELTRLSSTTIWRLEKRGVFPKRFMVPGVRRSLWKAADVEEFIHRPPRRDRANVRGRLNEAVTWIESRGWLWRGATGDSPLHWPIGVGTRGTILDTCAAVRPQAGSIIPIDGRL